MPASISLPQLEDLRIASPCCARWEDMPGDAVRRHCGECQMQVTNLSAMTRQEAQAFILQHSVNGEGGRVCVRLFRRHDGTVLTADCPVGFAAIRAGARAAWARLVALCALMGVTSAGAIASSRRDAFAMRRLTPVRWLEERLHPQPPVTGKMIMGDFCVPAPTPNRNLLPSAPTRNTP